ncbi:MAG: hypothetical protein A2231_12590 [Candidatus Firestonebacteria bacterium RIFOXYA2_FULL_40_8]|nr:MAG: hypothetical protein A2231_12590 [Candidatus Firestonebacteria bacterium RIFOXYA2_FULL_40_8]
MRKVLFLVFCIALLNPVFGEDTKPKVNKEMARYSQKGRMPKDAVETAIFEWIETANKKLPQYIVDYFEGVSKDYPETVDYIEGKKITEQDVVAAGYKGELKEGKITALKKYDPKEGSFLEIESQFGRSGNRDENESELFLLTKEKTVKLAKAGRGEDNFRLLYLGKDSPLVIEGLAFSGGSGWGKNYFYYVDDKISKPFKVSNWTRGEFLLRDIDGCGLAEIISAGGRASAKAGLADELKKKGVETSGNFIKLSRNSVAKWQNGKLEQVGDYYFYEN